LPSSDFGELFSSSWSNTIEEILLGQDVIILTPYSMTWSDSYKARYRLQKDLLKSKAFIFSKIFKSILL